MFFIKKILMLPTNLFNNKINKLNEFLLEIQLIKRKRLRHDVYLRISCDQFMTVITTEIINEQNHKKNQFFSFIYFFYLLEKYI